VVYLKDLLFKIIETAKEKTPQYFQSYSYIPSLIRLILLNKKGIISFDDIKTINDKMNNYIVREDQNVTLIFIFDQLMENLRFDEFDVTNIIGVSYLKNDFIILLKYLFYANVSQKMDLYVSKNIKFGSKLD